MSAECASCSGRCCYDIVVRVTPFDIARIARAHDLRFDEIVRPWEEPEPSPFGVRLDGSPRRYVPILQRHAREAGACAFLAHVSPEVKRCGIYADRPLVCRVYPFEVRVGSVDVRRDARCAEGAWDLATFDYRAKADEFETYVAENEATVRLVARWNERVIPADADLGFAAYLAFVEDEIATCLPGTPVIGA